MMSETFSDEINLGELIFFLPLDIKPIVRAYEKSLSKLVKARYSRVHNEVCLRENLYPSYSNIRLHDKDAEKEAFTLTFRQQLIQREVDLASEKIKQLEKDVTRLKDEIHEKILDPILLEQLLKCIDSNIVKVDFTTKSTILKKLQKLYQGKLTLHQDNVGFINLSKYQPTDSEKKFLQLGLNCHIKPKFYP